MLTGESCFLRVATLHASDPSPGMVNTLPHGVSVPQGTGAAATLDSPISSLSLLPESTRTCVSERASSPYGRFDDKGGWERKENVEAFANFVRHAPGTAQPQSRLQPCSTSHRRIRAGVCPDSYPLSLRLIAPSGAPSTNLSGTRLAVGWQVRANALSVVRLTFRCGGALVCCLVIASLIANSSRPPPATPRQEFTRQARGALCPP